MLRNRLTLTAIMLCCAVTGAHCGESPASTSASKGIWINHAELRALPTSGAAWKQLYEVAAKPVEGTDLSDQEDDTNVRVMAKALVYARTGSEAQRNEAIAAIMGAIGSEFGARTLALGRNLVALVIAADLVGLPTEDEARFRAWLRELLDKSFRGKTLRTTHEKRPNNWGTHAGASRAAIAAYLGDDAEMQRVAQVFRGWLGDRSAYAQFKFKSLSWQADADHPVGINPAGARRDGHSIDGVLPDDQRRGGSFVWPPPKENYVYGALQGALAQAVILHRAGYDVWEWQDRALLRAFKWLHEEAGYPPTGDDVWELVLVDHFYGTSYWDGSPTKPGKNIGWVDWTHAKHAKSKRTE